ncbi:thioredoxin [Paxillus ammoniavirescens]|nr:thioredoxin [Paxillus ammoniavirescens]
MTITPIDSYPDFRQICKVIKPAFEKLSNDHGGVADFYSVDVNSYDDIGHEVGITHMPTFMAFKNGDVLGTVVGAHIALLSEFVAKHAPIS